ncbi:DDE_3 domain-containing protein [Trichonephila clavipes]|uniref:DDE_3 domain-containing protein n=1 Tax=Trichonephila clavipes TaxID=2585209 RepID=A0A8X6VMI6_TRICX|nr:DDE_3 domain-containing protein [Trichonephila clavipes]
MFSDESRFSLQSDSRRTLIWRAPGTRYHQENTIERHLYGGAGWLVFGRIILGSRTDLHVQSVTMIGHIYRDVILEQHVGLFRVVLVVIGSVFILSAPILNTSVYKECFFPDSRLNNAFKLCNFISKIMVDFHKRILFSDEAHFWLNGYVNKQNCRIWSEANPQVYVETPLPPEKLTVWCALWAGGILLQKR